MKAIDQDFLRERTSVLDAHLARVTERLPSNAVEFARGADVMDAVSLHLLLGIQVVLDLAIFACIHFGLQAPASYDDAMGRLEHGGYIEDPLADRLEKAAAFRDAFVHASDEIDPAAVYRAAKVLPDDLRAFVASLAQKVSI